MTLEELRKELSELQKAKINDYAIMLEVRNKIQIIEDKIKKLSK